MCLAIILFFFFSLWDGSNQCNWGMVLTIRRMADTRIRMVHELYSPGRMRTMHGRQLHAIQQPPSGLNDSMMALLGSRHIQRLQLIQQQQQTNIRGV